MASPRAMINQVIQFGVEDSPGVGGTAVNRLGTYNSQIAPVAAGAFGQFRASGNKYVGQLVPTDIYAEGPFTDAVDFNTANFMWAGNAGFDADAASGGRGDADGGGAFTYQYKTLPDEPLNVVTYVVQEGQVGAVYNYNNVVVPDLGMRFMRTGALQMNGRILGRKQDPGTSLADPTRRKGRAGSGLKTGLWSADNWEDLVGNTGSIARFDPFGIDLAFRHNGVFAPWFALDDSIISFGGTLEQAIDGGFTVSVLADVDESLSDIAGRLNYASMEEGTQLFIKVITVGPIIHDDVPFSQEVNMSGQISGPPRKQNAGPLRIWQWDVIFTPDDTASLDFLSKVVCTLDPSAFDVV